MPLVKSSFLNEESEDAKCQFARASCFIRQVPFFEMRSLPLSRFVHVTNGFEGEAVAGE